MSNREEFEKAYTNAFIGEELKGLESIIFARFEIGGEYAQDKVATAYAMWQSRVPEGYVVVPVDPTEDMIMAGCMEHGGYDVIDSKSIYKAMIEAVEK